MKAGGGGCAARLGGGAVVIHAPHPPAARRCQGRVGCVDDDLRAWEKMARVLMERGEDDDDETMLRALCTRDGQRSPSQLRARARD